MKFRFTNWVPLEAQEAINIFYPGVTVLEARYMLQRLASRPTMKDAWAELKHFKKVTPGFLVASTLMAWFSVMRDDRARRYVASASGKRSGTEHWPAPAQTRADSGHLEA